MHVGLGGRGAADDRGLAEEAGTLKTEAVGLREALMVFSEARARGRGQVRAIFCTPGS